MSLKITGSSEKSLGLAPVGVRVSGVDNTGVGLHLQGRDVLPV